MPQPTLTLGVAGGADPLVGAWLDGHLFIPNRNRETYVHGEALCAQVARLAVCIGPSARSAVSSLEGWPSEFADSFKLVLERLSSNQSTLSGVGAPAERFCRQFQVVERWPSEVEGSFMFWGRRPNDCLTILSSY